MLLQFYRRITSTKSAYLTSMWPCIVITFLIIKPTRCTQIYFGMKPHMFWTVPLIPSWSCSQAVSKTVRHIPLLCVQWKTPDDGQRNCPKHVEVRSKNKFEKIVHLVGFIISKFAYYFQNKKHLHTKLHNPVLKYSSISPTFLWYTINKNGNLY